MAPAVTVPPRNSPPEASPEKPPKHTPQGTSQPKQSKPKPHPAPQTKSLNPPNNQQKKQHRKPIIDWFQRKLGGSVKGKRPVDEGLANGRVSGGQRAGNRVVSAGTPSSGAAGGRQQTKLDAAAAARRKTVSLNGDDDNAQYTRHSDDENEDDHSLNGSLAEDSVWSPNSVQEADEDASLRPLPPSSPPSPSPSRSSSSYLSDPRTFKSIAASTKPTTLLSIDLHGNGVAHIAQAPLTPTRQPHARSSSTATNPNAGAGQAPPSPQTSSRPVSLQDPLSTATTQNPNPNPNSLIVQAPLHTTHHPRNNPRPLSPPLDDASMLTLASSAYAIPGLRVAGVANWSSPPSAVGGGGDSVSHFGGTYADAESTSQLAIDDERLDDRDADASVRALRPRSTRRGSWESEASRWSARIQVTGPPSLGRERSLWTTNSVRTGMLSTENVDDIEQLDEMADDDVTGEVNADRGAEEKLDERGDEKSAPAETVVGGETPNIRLDGSKPLPVEDAAPAQSAEGHGRSTVDRKISSDTVNSPIAGEAEDKTEAPKFYEPKVEEEEEQVKVEEQTQKKAEANDVGRAEEVQLTPALVANATPESLTKQSEAAKVVKPAVVNGSESQDTAEETEVVTNPAK
ncbi:hypothetical protein V5O48_000024 [Marasmius crinis-equi]|uniref:Uncharacterized protein n=1 Tax=Marasmius crinis-equi TaxID=585013 RepID=A0ABR3G2I3_9AGAR